MFTVPSLRARECTKEEKDILNILFLLLPLLNVIVPFIWKSFPFVFSTDVVACGAVYFWKKGASSPFFEKPNTSDMQVGADPSAESLSSEELGE